MMSSTHKPRSVSSNECNKEVLDMITKNVDAILTLCSADLELRNYALKFQLEQAADKAVYDSAGEAADEMEHMRKVLQRMINLAMAVATHVLRRTMNDKGKLSIEMNTASQTSNVLLRSSSVENFTEGTSAWVEVGAHLSYVSVDLLSLVCIGHKNLRQRLQMYMMEKGILRYISEALDITQEHEITYFQEGFKTEHIRLIANLCFDNVDCSKAIVRDDDILRKVLSATRIDEENPGMVEWAEFTIRNLCTCIYEAQEKLKQLTPIRIAEDSQHFFNPRISYGLNHTGKLHMDFVKE